VAHVCGGIPRVSETPPADVQAIGVLAHQLFGIDGVEPGLKEEITENDILDAAVNWGFGRTGGGDGRKVVVEENDEGVARLFCSEDACAMDGLTEQDVWYRAATSD
jgi:hypothetical protein